MTDLTRHNALGDRPDVGRPSRPAGGLPGKHQDCTALVDFRPIGWTGVVIALIVGVPGAWMVYSGSRLSDEPQ
jgi:hypothetical protein